MLGSLQRSFTRNAFRPLTRRQGAPGRQPRRSYFGGIEHFPLENTPRPPLWFRPVPIATAIFIVYATYRVLVVPEIRCREWNTYIRREIDSYQLVSWFGLHKTSMESLKVILKTTEDHPLSSPHSDPLYGISLALGASAMAFRDYRVATEAYKDAYEKLLELCEQYPERVDAARELLAKDIHLPEWGSRSVPEILEILSALKDCKKRAEFESVYTAFQLDNPNST